jgi:hypothetical protein
MDASMSCLGLVGHPDPNAELGAKIGVVVGGRGGGGIASVKIKRSQPNGARNNMPAQ